MPRWLVIGGATAALTLLLALLRFAIDLLGVVFLLVLAGFSLRALSDWLADGDSVSGWSVVAVVLSVFGTFAVGLWLFDGRDAARSSVIERRLPVVLTRAIDWAEGQGWGRRVLLPGGPIDRMARRETASAGPAQVGGSTTAQGSGGGRPASAATRPGPAADAPQPRVKTAAPRRRERIRVRAPEAEGAVNAGPAQATSPGAAQPITQTATHLASTQPSARVGTSVRLVATVSATGAARPKGMVVFRNGDEVLGSALLRPQDSEAIASLVVLRLPVGAHLVSAEYLGQDGFDGSRSAVLTQVVTRR